jgi:hypothetical protein
VFLEGAVLAGIIMPPAAGSTWLVANLTLLSSVDGVVFNNVYDRNGNEYVLQASPGRTIAVSIIDLGAPRYVIVRSGTSGIAVVQTSQQVLQVVLQQGG